MQLFLDAGFDGSMKGRFSPWRAFAADEPSGGLARVQKGFLRPDQRIDRGWPETSRLNLPLDRRELLKVAGASLMVGAGFPSSCWSAAPPDHLSATASFIALGQRPETLIFPPPREMEFSGHRFVLDRTASILLPANPSANDLLLCRFLIDELSDRYDLRPEIEHASRLPQASKAGRLILMGSIENPLIRECRAREHLDLADRNPGTEGYILQVDEQTVVIAGSDERGAFYGLQSLRQIVGKGPQGLLIPGVRVRDWPDKPFRGIKLYTPGRNNIPFFKRFLRDCVALHKFNTVMMEMNACMRLDRHPELNAGWVEFARETNYSRRNYPPGALHNREQNSSHQDCGDGGFIEKDEVAGLVRWAEQHYVEVVPEIPSLTHSYYLLTKHKDLSDVPGDKWPDTYCPSNPKSYELLFEVMDEYVEVTKPRMVHAGHDEWFAPFGMCPRCQSKDPGELYGQDLRKIHDYLTAKGIRMAIWGDYLLENVRGKGLQKRTAPDGWTYNSPGAMTPQQVEELVPKDILIFNWFWGEEEKGELNEAELDGFGFHQVYGNMEPDLHNYEERSRRGTLMGGAPSSWAATTEFNMGKDLLYSILGCSSLLWSKQVIPSDKLSSLTQSLVPDIRCRLSGETPPSETGDPVLPVDISAFFNMPSREHTFGVDLRGIESGRVAAGSKVFELAASQPRDSRAAIIVGAQGSEPNSPPREVSGIKVGQDATSLIFLHACARPATNKEAYRLIWDFVDSADLLGSYEVVYEDLLSEVIPIRYGVNILEWNWGRRQGSRSYCYGADFVVCAREQADPVTFFAFEWTSPRLGKVIREVRLRASTGFRGAVPGFENTFGEVIPANAVILAALSLVSRRG
jgi:glycosyl hydrolase family 20